MRNAIASALRLGLVVLVVAGLALSGLALAQSGDEADSPTAVPTQSPAESQAQPETEDDDATGDQPFRFGRRNRAHHLFEIAAGTIGITPAELADQLGEDGATIASVAEANGSSADAVVQAALDALTERLDKAVADERLTQEAADERLADAEERLTDAVTSEPPLGGRRGPGPGGHAKVDAEAIAEVLGLTVDDLRAAREAGTTLAELAEQQGVSVDDLVAVMVAPLAERLEEAVAGGDLTQEEADQRLADAEARATERTESGEGFCGPGGRGRGPRRGPGPGIGSDFDGPADPAAGGDVIDA